MFEKLTRVTDVKHEIGDMAVVYRYTAGIAGERFFLEIKENARFIGTQCVKCNVTYVPPRIYCERCFENIENAWVDVGKRGVVHTYSVAYIDENGKRLDKPIVWAFIRIANGGLIHMIDEVDPKDVKIGMVVEPAFKDKVERIGSITDIKYFKPAS